MAIDESTRIGADGQRRPINEVDPDAPAVPYRWSPNEWTGEGTGETLVRNGSHWEAGPAGVAVTSVEPDEPTDELIWVDTSDDPIVVKQFIDDDWVTLEAP